MAKMFYTLEETAAKLGITQDQVKEMAGSGKLQQFRDRDKLMFKREQVDAIGSGGSGTEDTGTPIPLAKSGETDTINIASDTNPPRKEDPRSATGISVFDAGEVEHADPMAQTQVNTPAVVDQEQLALESVGSGSGLLDLTRESDDTSLGAELLDEIYPGSGGEASDGKSASVPGSSGVFDGAIAVESGPSGLENLQQPDAGSPGMVTLGDAEEVYDPVGSGASAGALLGALVAIFLAITVVVSSVAGVPSKLVASMTVTPGTVWMYTGILAAVTIICVFVGLFIGKAQAR